MAIRLNKQVEGSANVFHDNFNQLIELAEQKDPDFKTEPLPKDLEDLHKQRTSIIYQGRFRRLLYKFLRRKPTINSHEIAKNIVNYSELNQTHLEVGEKKRAIKWIKKLKELQIKKHPKSQKSINNEYNKFIGILEKLNAKELSPQIKQIYKDAGRSKLT